MFQFALRAQVVSATIEAPVTENELVEGSAVTVRYVVVAEPKATWSPTLSHVFAEAAFVNVVDVAVPVPEFVGDTSIFASAQVPSTLPVAESDSGDEPDSSPSWEKKVYL